jgi:hypothetical protein
MNKIFNLLKNNINDMADMLIVEVRAMSKSAVWGSAMRILRDLLPNCFYTH